MLFYRQKLLLALLENLGGNLGATDFQKSLFLFTTHCEKDKSYDFVPYRFGCFSFLASVDKNKLIEKGYLKDITSWELAKKNLNHTNVLKKGDAKKMLIFADRFGPMRGKSLIRHVYNNHPYYAINSNVLDTYLTPAEINKVHAAKPVKCEESVFATIGYEGDSIEAYLNKLIINDIRLLVDVRKNPLSRKYGFSKRTLSSLLSKFGIKYAHLSDLGIDSSQRKNLKNQQDYDCLFNEYKRTVLKKQSDTLVELYDLYKNNIRIAITCFERDHCQCHRSKVSDAIESMSAGEIKTLHL